MSQNKQNKIVLIPSDNVVNAYIPSLVNAYKDAGCTVFTGVANFFLTNIIPDILHFQWPENLYLNNDFSIFGDVLVTIKKRITFFKENGTKVIWTVHNTEPHLSKNRDLDEQIYFLFIEEADILVHHGKKSIELMGLKYNKTIKKTNIVCPHGDYSIQYQFVNKGQARQELNLPLNKTILMHFGFIKGYKGYELVSRIFSGWREKNKYLFTAGHLNARRNPRAMLFRIWYGIIFSRGYRKGFDLDIIPNSKIGLYFSAADIILLSHKKGLTSGIIPLAITFSKPIVYPDIGNFKEQIGDWVAESYESGNINSAIKAIYKLNNRINNCNLNNSSWLQKNSWSIHVNIILDKLESL